MTHPIDAWHSIAKARDPRALAGLLAEDVVFHSPVVHVGHAWAMWWSEFPACESWSSICHW